MNIIKIMSSEYSCAKKWFSFGVVLQVLMVGLALAKILLNSNLINFFIFLFPIIFFITKHHMGWHKEFAERIRKEALISDGFGTVISGLFLAEIHGLCGEIDVKDPVPENYFSSKLPPGPKRLMENIAESSFFTWHLSSLIKQTILVIAILLGILVISVAWWIFHGNLGQYGGSVAGFFSGFILLFAASYFTDMYFNYQKLEKESENIFKESGIFLSGMVVGEIQSIKLLSDYNCILAAAFPIPSWCYNLKCATLTAAWEKYLAKGTV